MIRTLVCALLCTVGTLVPATAGDKPTPELKGIKVVSYKLSVQLPNKGRCAIDLKAWNTAIDFVANQSTKLKLIREADHFWPTDPSLLFSILTTEMKSGCAATLSAEVWAALEPTKIIATDKFVDHPYTIIWTERQLLSGPFATFSSFATETSEQIMKSFVNDWARSQEEH